MVYIWFCYCVIWAIRLISTAETVYRVKTQTFSTAKNLDSNSDMNHLKHIAYKSNVRSQMEVCKHQNRTAKETVFIGWIWSLKCMRLFVYVHKQESLYFSLPLSGPQLCRYIIHCMHVKSIEGRIWYTFSAGRRPLEFAIYSSFTNTAWESKLDKDHRERP